MADANLVYFLPRSYRGKAKVVFSYLVSNDVKLTKKDRIIYPDGTIGSHILDLVKYTVSPFEMDSPKDSIKFMKYLEEIGVPELAIVKRKD